MNIARILAFLLSVFFLFLVPLSADENDIDLRYDLCIDRAEIPLGGYAQVDLFLRNVGNRTLKFRVDRVDVPVRLVNCDGNQRKKISIPERWRELPPGSLTFITRQLPVDYGYSEILLGDYVASFVISISDGISDWKIEKNIKYSIVLPGVFDDNNWMEFESEKKACDSMNGKEIPVRDFDVAAAKRTAEERAAAESRIRVEKRSSSTDFEKFVGTESYGRFLDLYVKRGYLNDYEGRLRQLEEVLEGRLPYSEEPFMRSFDVEIPAIRARSNRAFHDIEQVLVVVYREGGASALEYLSKVEKSGLGCAEVEFLHECEKRIRESLSASASVPPN